MIMANTNDMASRSCRDFAEVLASKAAVPGGGGASAMAGALGVALGSMVIHLTQGKKKFADVEEEFAELEKKADDIRQRLLDLIQEDADGFLPLSKAYGLPKETEEEKKHKEEVLEVELDRACDVPLKIMKCCAESLEILEIVAVKGSKMAVSDAAAGALLSGSAMECASLNVYINAKSLKNRERAAQIRKESDDLLAKWLPRARKLADTVFDGLKS